LGLGNFTLPVSQVLIAIASATNASGGRVLKDSFRAAPARWRLRMASPQTPSADPQTPTPDWESPLAALQAPPVALPTPLAGMETPFAN
jgi:hypothetical protein